MPGFYQSFTTARATEPDAASLFAQLRALDASAGIQHTGGSSTYVLKKATAWTGPQITAAQNVVDTAPASSPQLDAQAFVDVLPIWAKAEALAIIDQLNIIRNLLSPPKTPDITSAQAIAAIRAKAGTL